MIYFKKLRYMNIMSTGNVFTEIDFTKSKTTLIVGENGAGKSTMIEALCFVLYGKPFRNVNKPQLINSITQKNLLVEVEFSIGKKDYLVRRGMRPNIFEIFLNGTMINQNAEMKEYQDVLEKNIIKMNSKSFKQIVVLGSANYIPFMQLSAGDRRQVIEDLLDIQIFSTMNQLLKEKLYLNKSSLKDLDYQIHLVVQKIDLTQKHIKSLKTNNDDLVKKKKESIRLTEHKVSEINILIDKCNKSIDELSPSIVDSERMNEKRTKLLDLETKFESKIRQVKKEVSFFGEHDNCPTCKQGIDHNFKSERIDKKNNQLEELKINLEKIESDIKDLDEKISVVLNIVKDIANLNKDLQAHHAEIKFLQSNIKFLAEEIDSIKSNTGQIEISFDEVEKLNEELKIYNKNRQDLFKQRELLDVASTLLKDGGIKTRVIRQFVPVINKLVNKYLAALDFFVNFELDEQFNEKIRSRFRDEFSYASFSEGEKFRIDISLMLTWRSIAKLRNSASTNLLIMDEVFDGSLDNNGIEEFLKVLDSVSSESNIYVISHKGDNLFDKFDSVLRFEKHSNFSKLAA